MPQVGPISELHMAVLSLEGRDCWLKQSVNINTASLKGMWYRYTMGYYSAVKRSETLPSATTRMDLESILSKVSQTEKDRYCRISLICGTYRKTNKPNKQTKPQTRSHRKQIGGCQKWGVCKMGERSQNVQISSYKMSESWECNVQPVIIVINTVLHI